MQYFMTFLFCLVLALPLAADSVSQSFDELLEGYVTEGKVDYQGLRAEQREELEAFVASLAEADLESMTHIEKIAFWLDAYNGLVVYQVVTKDDAPDSARKRARFFRGRRYQVAGNSMTLDEIEHEALRPLAKDPRVHFVLVCGAQSCPPLRASSFLGEKNLEETLESATREYINNPDNVTINTEERKIVLNKIFDWYAEDFDDVLEFVARYRPVEERELLQSGTWDILYRDYDWTLNQAQEN